VAYSCQHLYPRPKLVIVNFPHNPSAVTIDPEFYVELVQLAKRYGFMVISDMAYGDIGFDGYQPPSFLATPGALDVGIELTTMSKGYNMAGWRVGYATGNAEMLKALATVKAYYDYGMFLPIQVAAIVALRDTDAAVEAAMYWWKDCDGWDGTLRRRGLGCLSGPRSRRAGRRRWTR
jgi:alanine-synthesizing transaminase